MVIKFDELHSVDIKGVNLASEREVSIAIGKSYGVKEIPVERISVYSIKGKLVDLPKEIHLYRCKVPIQCTVEYGNKEQIFYWVHDFILKELRPVLKEDVERELEERLKDLKEISLKDLLELEVEPVEEVVPKEDELYIPTVKKEKLPSIEDVADDPELLHELPDSLRTIFGNRVYDKRWYQMWHAKMMSLGGGYKRLYNPSFLKLKPQEMLIDRFTPYLLSGRYIERAIDNIDMRMLGLTETELGRFRVT